MQIPFETLRVFWYEVFRQRLAVVYGFLFINGVVIALALFWPPTYKSSATIFVEHKNIIQPLLHGTAVATDVQDQAKMAREIIFHRKAMTQVLEQVGVLRDGQSGIERERLLEGTKARTRITNVDTNLIRIEHKDGEPERAYRTTQKLAEVFIGASLQSQNQESQAAFEFIDRQVKEYQDKITGTDDMLKEFRQKNLDARPETGAEISRRIDALQATIEKTALELKEARNKEQMLERQLSGESEVIGNVTREHQYTARVAELQAQLDNLRLTYHDSYPDVVRIKHQIEDLTEAAAAVRREARGAARTPSAHTADSIRANPFYQQLKQQLFETRTYMQALNTRLSESRTLLRGETERATRAHGSEATLAAMTRDYEVNREIYQDLLRRRENARVSRDLGRDKQALTVRIHEPAAVPLRPSGVRSLHIAVGGLLLSVVLPLGVLYGLVHLDPRLRTEATIATRLKLPTLAVVPHFWSPSERHDLDREFQWMRRAVMATASFVVVFGALRAFEVM